MIRAIDILNLPSMREGYIAAGGNGAYRVIRRFEILEETYPAVVQYLDEGIFYLTSFWSLADNKENRIHLIEAMIEHRCAGIGIMPGSYLNEEIDPEILKLGNECGFPILYIPVTVRWGDMVSEYSIIANNSMESIERSWMDMALGTFVDFHVNKDPDMLCRKMSEILQLPIVMSALTVYSYGTEGITVAFLISRIQKIRQNEGNTMQSPMMLRIDSSRLAVVYFGENSMVTCCPSRGSVQENMLQLYHQMAPYIVRELDNISQGSKIRKIEPAIPYYGKAKIYIAFMRFDSFDKSKLNFDRKYILYESNYNQKYCILLIPEEEGMKSPYDVYCRLSEDNKPNLFVFSQRKYKNKELHREIMRIKNLLNSLLFLKGLYSMDELSLLYLLTNAPREQKVLLYSADQLKIKYSDEVIIFLNTLRLYLVLRSIKEVSQLLGIHVNSVKYRIEKAVQYMEMGSDLSLNEISSLGTLLYLERMTAERR